MCLVIATAMPALCAHAALAAPCDSLSLTDSTGATYATDEFAQFRVSNRDAITNTGNIYFDYEYNIAYEHAANDGCAFEDGGREIVWPNEAFGAVLVRSKMFVPEDGTAFLRQLWIFQNVGTASEELTVHNFGRSLYDTRDVLTTSSGDAVGTAADDWLTWNNDDDATDPAVAYVWQGDDPGLRAPVDQVYQDCCTNPGQFNPVVDTTTGTGGEVNTRAQLRIEPGETEILMQVYALRATPTEAATTAAAFAATPDELFASMTDAEIRAVQNFHPIDADQDGVDNDVDNCLHDPNPDQANADGDAQGDACDADDDGDGLSDDVEIAFGTDPGRADMDGDGLSDPADPCPKLAGPANGCPAAAGPGPLLQPPAAIIVGRLDPRSTTATLTPARDRRLPFVFTARGSVLPPDGLSAQQACSSPGFVNVVVRRGRKVVARRRAQLLPDCTFVVQMRFRNRRRVGRGRRSLTFTVSWLGNRFLEPVRIASLARGIG